MRACIFSLLFMLVALNAQAGLRVGVVVPEMQDEFWIKYLSFMERGAEQLHIDLLERDAKGEAMGLEGHARGLLDIGVDALVVTPMGDNYRISASLGKILQSANEKHIPVAITLTPLPHDLRNGLAQGQRPFLVWVGPDYLNAGKLAAIAAIESASPSPDGKQRVLALAPGKDAIAGDQRILGLEHAFNQRTNATLVEVVPSEVWGKNLGSILKHHKDVGAIWCGDGVAALTAQAVANEQGLIQPITAMDLLPENLFPMHEERVTFDIGGGWLSGGYALLLLYANIQGLPEKDIPSVQSFALLPVTSGSLASYESNYPEGLPSLDFQKAAEGLAQGESIIKDLEHSY